MAIGVGGEDHVGVAPTEGQHPAVEIDDPIALHERRGRLGQTDRADVGVAGNAADRLLALVLAAAHQQVGDAFLGDDVGDVVGVDHHRCQIEQH